MSADVILVPGALLLDAHLVGSAKLLWMARQLLAHRLAVPGKGARRRGVANPGVAAPGAGNGPVPVSSRRLEHLSGLARHTIRCGLARLQTAGWSLAVPTTRSRAGPSGQARAIVPADLVLDRGIPHFARVIYGILQLTPGFRGAAGQFTYTSLCQLTGLSRSALKPAIRALETSGWLQTTQQHKYSPIQFTLRNPAADQMQAVANAAERRVRGAEYRGEALMREYLSLLVDCDEFEDNASPGYLVNPQTGHELQFDRYYPPGVAFEYNGPQHYAPTKKFPSVEKFLARRTRDLLKHGYCATRGVRLVVVHAEDLSLKGMQKKLESLSGLLPLRNVEGKGPLVAILESLSRACQNRARDDQPTLAPEALQAMIRAAWVAAGGSGSGGVTPAGQAAAVLSPGV